MCRRCKTKFDGLKPFLSKNITTDRSIVDKMQTALVIRKFKAEIEIIGIVKTPKVKVLLTPPVFMIKNKYQINHAGPNREK